MAVLTSLPEKVADTAKPLSGDELLRHVFAAKQAILRQSSCMHKEHKPNSVIFTTAIELDCFCSVFGWLLSL